MKFVEDAKYDCWLALHIILLTQLMAQMVLFCFLVIELPMYD
jgi:hypothetical protein